jgi:rod shape-determining protein MreC
VKEKRRFALLFGLIFLHLVLISIQVPKGEKPTYFEKAFFAVFSPLQNGVVSLSRGLRNFWQNYFYFRDVRRQNQSMREEIFLLRQENLALKNMLLSFRGEKEIRELLSTLSRSILVASVIGFDSSQVYKSITLNRGSLDGILKDMAVLDRKGRLVGRVIDPITLKQARVQLITDEESGVGVITERLRVVGILQGNGQGAGLMKYVLKTNKGIENGDEVVTSGFDGVYPAGIPVGKIVTVDEAPETAIFKKIVVQPYFDFSDLSQVAVFTVDLKALW